MFGLSPSCVTCSRGRQAGNFPQADFWPAWLSVGSTSRLLVIRRLGHLPRVYARARQEKQSRLCVSDCTSVGRCKGTLKRRERVGALQQTEHL